MKDIRVYIKLKAYPEFSKFDHFLLATIDIYKNDKLQLPLLSVLKTAEKQYKKDEQIQWIMIEEKEYGIALDEV